MNGISQWTRARKMRRTIEVECTGECDIEEFSTEVLIDELGRRQTIIPCKDREEIILVYEAINLNRIEEALWRMERLLWPKWTSMEKCEEAKAKAK